MRPLDADDYVALAAIVLFVIAMALSIIFGP